MVKYGGIVGFGGAHTTEFIMSAHLAVTPGEIVLGNRIRCCFPARVADEMLPADDEDLISMVRTAVGHHTLCQCNARLWVVNVIHHIAPQLEKTEEQLMRTRIGYYFAGMIER